MESLPIFLWQVVSIGSVFVISTLVGHLSLQRNVNLWLRTAVVVGWLMLLAVVGIAIVGGIIATIVVATSGDEKEEVPREQR